MSFNVEIKQSFLSDFIHLNRDLQNKVVNAIDELYETPNSPRGDTIKCLKYYKYLWRYRIGDYRMVYAVFPKQNGILIIAIGPRGEIYERLNYTPDEPENNIFCEAFEKALDPDQETPKEWEDYIEKERNRKSKIESRTLPYQLTSTQLSIWNIPPQFHKTFQHCETEDDLLGTNVPQEVLLRLIDCIWPADVSKITQSQNFILQQPKDLIRFVKGDLINFLLALDGDQQKLVDFSLSGPTLVKGGPGSGKSTVALYRIGTIIHNSVEMNKPTRILFTTYTNSLVNASNQLLNRILEKENLSKNSSLVQVKVDTLDKIAMQIFSSNENHPRMAQISDQKYSLVHARTNFKPEGDNSIEQFSIRKFINNLRDEYLLEEFEWVIEGRGISTVDEYLKTDRSGRGYSFDNRIRKAVWQLYEHSRTFIHQLSLITWGELRIKSIEKVMSGEWKEKWDYVLVDEAQDLTPVALSLAIELCTNPKGLFFTADACQSLYNKGFAWKNVHETLNVTGRTRILKRNYRTTRQIAEAAQSIIHKTNAGDKEVLDQFYVHTGPKPKLYAAQNEIDMFMWLANEIQKASRELCLPIGSGAVLLPTNELAKNAAIQLSQVGLPTDYMSGKDLDLNSSKVKALTIHSAKGLEFPIVAIPYIEEGFLPRSLPDERAEDLEKHLNQELRILFVGCTRAMRRLLIAYRSTNLSRFLEDPDFNLWIPSVFS